MLALRNMPAINVFDQFVGCLRGDRLSRGPHFRAPMRMKMRGMPRLERTTGQVVPSRGAKLEVTCYSRGIQRRTELQ